MIYEKKEIINADMGRPYHGEPEKIYITPLTLGLQNLKAKNNKDTFGILLVQIIGKRKLKLEAFPGKQASEVNSFTKNAQVYER